MFTIEQANNNYPNGDGGGDDYPKDATFDTITVNKDATLNTITVNKDATFKVNDKEISFANHESRIKTLEQSGGGSSGDSSFTSISGYPEIILTQSNLTETDDNQTHTLTINIDNNVYKDYVGDMLLFVMPNTINVGEVKITKQADNTYTCPVIEYNENKKEYVLTNTPNQTTLFLRIISLFDYPISLFSNGDMQIRSIVQESTITTSNVIKCDKIDADNTFNLYRSPIPNMYDVRSFGELTSYWYMFFGFEEGSDEFNSLLNGQEFRFTEDAFGTSYKYTKKGNKWEGNNCYYRVPGSITKSQYNSGKATMFMKWDDTNQFILNTLISDIPDAYLFPTDNPLKWLYDNNKLTFDFYKTVKYKKDGFEGDYAYIEFDDDNTHNHDDKTVTITINIGKNMTCTWTYKNDGFSNYFEREANQIERIAMDQQSLIDYSRHFAKNGLYLLMPKGLIYPLSDDIGYVDGTNPFEFIANKCCYTITPRPEACTTLESNYNIRTKGIVIGQNIESHAFALNSIGNTVDRAVNRVEDIQQTCERLQEQITEMKTKTEILTIVKDVCQIAGGLFNVVRGIATLSTFSFGAVGGIACGAFTIGNNVKDVVEEEVIDGIIRDVDVLEPRKTSFDLELIDGPKETTFNGVDTIVCIYYIPYIYENYKLVLEQSLNVEILDYNPATQTFSKSGSEVVNVKYIPDKQALGIYCKQYDKVRIEYTKQVLSIGPNDLGIELTNDKILTAKAVKKLIDNNLKNEIDTLKARIEELENKNNNEELRKELDKQLTVLETRCLNIIPTIEITEDMTLEDRITLLESQCENIMIDNEPTVTTGLTLQDRLAIINKKCANIE